ncbi:MAG: hypothetical protein KatS3mg103_0164 [Phycisphaerales bacterium]|nr:MAG: hypothetical protein KatS3mg103_0164 [Phycisphaerales bacterium]
MGSAGRLHRGAARQRPALLGVDLRKAVILAEILDPPLALRPQQDMDRPPPIP